MSVIILFTLRLDRQAAVALALMIVALRIFIGRAPRTASSRSTLPTYRHAAARDLWDRQRTHRVFRGEAALVIGLLGFVSTVALAKFLMRGEVIDDDNFCRRPFPSGL